MALKIMVNKNYLPTCKSPYIVRSGNSDVVEFDRLVDKMAGRRTTLLWAYIVTQCENVSASSSLSAYGLNAARICPR